jgi:riboflavin biosynthesis pyrimidine reductase
MDGERPEPEPPRSRRIKPVIYPHLEFPAAPENRPYVFINMVTTIDGKILSGERDEPVFDLGSDVDHQTMKQIQRAAQAVIIGAGSLRATPVLNYPPDIFKVVLTASAKLDFQHMFFRSNAVVATDAPLPEGIERAPQALPELMKWLRERGVERLLCEGGAELNAAMFHAGCVDELFWTIAPKIKLGRDVPTYADGEPFGRSEIPRFQLVELHQNGDELFLRYRRKSA